MFWRVIFLNLAYCRVSTILQNEARQIEALKQYNIEKWFIDKVSGKNTERPQLQDMLDFAREGDVIYIHDLSRLARNIRDLLGILELLDKKKIHLVSNKEKIDTSTPTGRLMITIIGALNEFERDVLLERQREGIEIAKKNGKYKGRKPINIDPDDFKEKYDEYLQRKINKGELAKALNISRPTLDKILKEY